jgi:regulator of protease activity HflC (stomatin/prohibitin superfamily)
VIAALALSIRVVKQYERGVVFRFGRVIGTREPGLRFIIPVVDLMRRGSRRRPGQVGGGHRERGRPALPRQTLAGPERIDTVIREILAVQTEAWGVVVTLVELKDIQLPESMKRAMARQAEAEREKRAKIIAAHPLALQLRTLQTLVEIGVDKNTMVVVPAPG